MRFKEWVLSGAIALMFGFNSHAAENSAGALSQDDVLSYLEQVVQWQRDATALEPSASSTREVIFQDTLQQHATNALKGGFRFARLQAAMDQPEEDAASDASTPRQRIAQRAKETDILVTQLRAQKQAKNLTPAQRRAYDNRLQLAMAKQELFHNVLANITASSSSDAKGLVGKINNLARGIPELNPDTLKPNAGKADHATATDAPATAVAHPSNTILSLMGGVFDTMRKQTSLKDFADQSLRLETRSRELLKILRTELDQITDTDTTTAPIDTQLASFRQIGSVIMPLGETMFAITASEGALKDWQSALDQRMQALLAQLGIKLAFLAVLLAIPLVLGEVVRRAIGRYIIDPRRRRWANTARRIVVSVAVVFILLLSLVSDFSSFATFAGFLTAGLAVALQGVLMSLVAHFFFYGRYGVRPGDTVNVSGVTGEIVQIGMIRFYLRELVAGEAGAWSESGRIVAFPNSILFQPQAFYKYVGQLP